MAERTCLVRLEEEFDIEIDWRGFELHPEIPEGGVSLSSLFSGERIDEMREHVTRFASKFGITDLEVSDHMPSTRKALAVAEYARDRGRLEEFRTAVMSGFWREGLDIESEEDLSLLIARAGLDPAEAIDAASDPRYLDRLRRAAREAHEMEVRGVPTFFFGADEVVVGCQPYDSLARAAEASGARRRSTGKPPASH